MTRRFFWLIPDCARFRIVFEDNETVLGINKRNEHRLFRKDTGIIAFSKPKGLRTRAKAFLEKEIANKKAAVNAISKNFARKQTA
jgi:hypothetical protein